MGDIYLAEDTVPGRQVAVKAFDGAVRDGPRT